MENLLAMIDGRPPLNQTNFFDTITQEKPAQDLLSYRVSHFKRTFDDKDFPARKDHFLKVFMNEDEEKFYDNVRTDPSLKVKSFCCFAHLISASFIWAFLVYLISLF